MAKSPIIYTVRMDVTDEVRDQFEEWASGRHIEDLMAAGFLSAQRFRASKGKPEFLHLYELENVDLLSTDTYKAVAQNDPNIGQVRTGLQNHSASLYEQVVYLPSNGDGERVPGVGARHLITVQLEVQDGKEDELIEWHRTEHIPTLLQAEGMLAGRLCRRTAMHPSTPCLDPTWVSIYEMSGPETLGDPKVKEANSTEWAQQMHAVTTEARLCILERITPA